MINKPKKIAIIYAGAKHWGGVETYLEQLFQSVDRTKIDLVLVSLGEWSLTRRLQVANYPLQIVSGRRINPMTVLQIARYLRVNDVGLVVSQGTVANFYARLASMYSAVPSLVIVHSDARYDYPNVLVRFAYSAVDWLTRFATSRYITVSDYLKKQIVKSGIAADKIDVVYNGVTDNSKLEIRNSKLAKSQLVIGSIGRLHKVKNYRELILACASLEDINWKLQILGEGSERPHLENLISALGLSDKIKLVGYVDNVYEEVESIDIYVQPSLSEGFGITVVDAMLAEKPVIVSPGGSLPELVKDGKTGVVMSGFDSESIATAITGLVKDPEKAKSIALAGQKSARQRFGVGRWIQEMEKAFLEAAK